MATRKTPAARPGDAKRPVRLGVQLRHEIARLVGRDLADPRLEGLVVSSVALSADLRVAKVFYRIATVATGAELAARRKEAQAALERATGRLRKAVTARLELRVAPELRFVYDEGQDARDRIEALLDEVAHDARRARARRPD